MEELYGNMSLLELEKETDRALNETIDEIYLEYQSKRLNINYTWSEKVFFRHYTYSGEFSRCFQLKVDPSSEPRYQQLLSISKLVLKMKHQHYNLCILPSEKYFDITCLSYENYNFIKVETQRLAKKERCIDFEEKFGDCRSRMDCINQCFVRKMFEVYQNMSYYHREIIIKDLFSPIEWANLYFVSPTDEISNSHSECLEKYYGGFSCFDVQFQESVRNNKKNDSVQIELYYEIQRSITEEPSLYKLILDALMIVQTFFDISGFKLLTMILTFFELRTNKVYLFIVYVLMSIGFGLHTQYILNKVIAPLSYSQHFEIAERVENPETIFCFEASPYYTRSQVGGAKNLTGNYLNEITAELSPETVFEKAEYLNNQNKWVVLALNSSKGNDRFRIEINLFLQLKCFVFLIPLDYGRNQFHFAVNTEVLKVTFNRSFIEQNRAIVYFLTQNRHSMQLSKILNFSFKDQFGKSVSYTVNQESFEMIYQDRFNLLKNPLSLFYDSNDSNDVTSYLRKLIGNFKATHNRLTLNLPIKQKDFDYLIDDDLFDRYIDEIEKSDDRRPAQPNFKRLFAINHLRTEEKKRQNDPDFYLQFVYFRKVIIATNEYHYASLILSLLSNLSIWFGLKFLLIPNYFCEATQLVVLFYRRKVRRFFDRFF